MRPAKIVTDNIIIEPYKNWLNVKIDNIRMSIETTGDIYISTVSGEYIEIHTRRFIYEDEEGDISTWSLCFDVQVWKDKQLIERMRGITSYAYIGEKYVGVPDTHFEEFKEWIGKEDLNKEEAEYNQGEYLLFELLRERGMRYKVSKNG